MNDFVRAESRDPMEEILQSHPTDTPVKALGILKRDKYRQILSVIGLRIRMQRWIETIFWITILYLGYSIVLIGILIQSESSAEFIANSLPLNALTPFIWSAFTVILAILTFGMIVLISDILSGVMKTLRECMTAPCITWYYPRNKILFLREAVIVSGMNLHHIPLSRITWICLDRAPDSYFLIRTWVTHPASSQIVIRTSDQRSYKVGNHSFFTNAMRNEQEEILQLLCNCCPHANFGSSYDYELWRTKQ